MLNVVIVDDEVPVLNLLKMVLEKTGKTNVLNTFTDPYEALEGIGEIKPEAVFLDIEMPEMNGLELATRLIEQNDELMIVFVTGYNQYALEAFQVNALDYLLKPVGLNAIDKCVSRLIKLKGLKEDLTTEGNIVKVRCFGDFEVYGKNGLVKWATRKVEEMLAYFIIHRDTNVEGWQLGEILWPEEAPDKVKANLHTTLFRLRKTIREEGLPIAIGSEKGGNGIYRCTLGQISCDLLEFENIIKKNIQVNKDNIAELEKFCHLYRDDLFVKKSYEWCENTRIWLQRHYLDLLKNMADFYSGEGLYQNAVNILLTAAAKSPFDEEIHKCLLRMYSEQKNRALLIKRHKEFEQRLMEEMGVEPQAETTKLYEMLLHK